jgi:hypothetical protein
MQTATDRGLLSKLNGRAARFRISMYVDDAVIFLKWMLKDVANLKLLLQNFGLGTGLQTNLQKTIVSAISYDSINLNELLAELSVARAHFPIKYHGLPLSNRKLCWWTSNPKLTRLLGDYPRGTHETSLKRSYPRNRYTSSW